MCLFLIAFLPLQLQKELKQSLIKSVEYFILKIITYSVQGINLELIIKIYNHCLIISNVLVCNNIFTSPIARKEKKKFRMHKLRY